MNKFLFKLTLFITLCSCSTNHLEDKVEFKINDEINYPEWIFGLNIWEDNVNTLNSLNSLVQNYELYDIKYSSVLIDSPWSLSYNDFLFDEDRYPSILDFIHRQMLKNKKTI